MRELPRAGSAHVKASGGKGVGALITYRNDSGETPEMQNEPCLACHERGNQTYWKASVHSGRGLSCIDCHTLMETTSGRQIARRTDITPFFINLAENEVCGQCHLQR